MNKKDTHATWTGQDDAPELTDDWFQAAELRDGNTVIRRGRPKSANPSVAISLRMPSDVLARWKSTGPGWQTRMVATLTSHAPRERS